MRKEIISHPQANAEQTIQQWLNVEDIARIELTSEDAEHPIEQALLLEQGSGWRAATSGKQTLQLIFSHPQTIKLIQLHFQENNAERTQEYSLRWSADEGKTYQEIVRQQWNFNAQSTTEIAKYQVELIELTTLELNINPNISGGDAIASLQALRLA